MRSFYWTAGCCLIFAGLFAVSYSGAQESAQKRAKSITERARAAAAAAERNAAAANAETEAPSGDQKAIEAVNAEFTRAFNAGDARALTSLFTEDARMSNEAGKTAEGTAAIQKRLTEYFKQSPGSKIVLRTDSIKFLTPDVAVEEGASQVLSTDADAKAAEFTPYTAIFVKRDGKWLHSVVRDYVVAKDDAASASAYDNLKELEWMVGDWVEEGTASRSLSNCRWAQNKHFIVWNYTIEAEGANAPAGTMFIGWDPLTSQIKSWVFDAAGGHGEATWTRHGEGQWVVKASGVLGDGRTASATQYVTLLKNDRASWTSVDRVAGGEVQPDMSEYIIVRRPPSPNSATKSSPSR